MRAYLCLVASVVSLVACGANHDASITSGAAPTSSAVGTTDPATPSPNGQTTTAVTAGDASVDGGAPSSSSSGGPVTPPPAPADVNITNGSTTFNGVQREYLLGMPRDYNASKAYPLVMLFHGNPGTKDEMRSLVPFETASHTDAILVYPDGIGGAWDLYTPTATNNDMDFIKALPGILASTVHIDLTKVYGFGFSGGSFFLTQFTCRFGGVFRAVAINSGGGPVEQQMGYPQRADGCYICPGGPVASLVVHGTADPVVDPQSGAYTAQCLSETDTCASTTSAASTSPCVTYDSCTSGKPVEWCLIPGLTHAPWTNAESEAWRFFNAAP